MNDIPYPLKNSKVKKIILKTPSHHNLYHLFRSKQRTHEYSKLDRARGKIGQIHEPLVLVLY